MATIDWTWRTTTGLPETVLAVVGRTHYDDKAWLTFKDSLVPGYYRLLGDPNIIGLACRTDERKQVAWTLSAWYSYDALKETVQKQVDWLSELVKKLEIGNQTRHNAYRMVNVEDLPLRWSSCEQMVQNVMKASPLGADAFPELSHILGISGDSSA